MKDMLLSRKSFLQLGLLSTASLLLPARAMAASSSPYSYTTDGYTYTGINYVSTSGGTVYATTTIQCNAARPTGYIGCSVAITHEVYGTLNYRTTYSSSYSDYHATSLSMSGTSGANYCNYGYMLIYNTSSGTYHWIRIPSSPYQTASSTTIDRYNYEFNEFGESIGNLFYYDLVGYVPDLILATGRDGKLGYVRKEDYWVPVPNSPEEACKEFAIERCRTVPVYLADGRTQIDCFDLYYGGMSDFIDLSIYND